MKALVASASSVLGRNVVRPPQRDGFEVTRFDLVGTDNEELRFATRGLRDAEEVSNALLRKDIVRHPGAISDVHSAAEQPSLDTEVNVGGSSDITDASAAAVAKVAFNPTWEVYEEAHYGPSRPGHVSPSLISSRRVGGGLGWKPRVSFTERLNELMESVTVQV